MSLGIPRLCVALVFLASRGVLGAQAATTPPRNAEPSEAGIPIASEAVKKSCGACHPSDAVGRMSRISFRRTTPEGWQETIRRMATLNGAPLDPAQARETLRYLSNELGLAPEEALPARFEVERRLVDFTYSDKDTHKTCSLCHSIGRAMLQRRTKEEWDLLVAMHRGYYPLVDFQGFRSMAPLPTEPGPDGRPPDRRQPVEKALDHLKAAFPLRTPEWAAWSANRRPPRLAGRWALRGHEPGFGPVYGEVEITAKAGTEDEFMTVARYVSARGGAAVERRGQAVVYTGFQWRGRSAAGEDTRREVMSVERDGPTISGRWFSGAYDEKGLDVTLTRLGSEPLVLGLAPRALRTGSTATVFIHGANLPATGAEVDFGPGVRIRRFAAAEGGLRAEVEVAADAPRGERDVFVGTAFAPRAAVVFDTVDALKVTPTAGLARVGGVRFAKRPEQFEARAFCHGADGKPDTKDDLDLGVVDAAWSLEEFTATFGDDDKQWAGTIDAKGLFTPAEDGPNPKRRGSRNNVGDLWVVATLDAASPWKPASPLRARAHLIVTVPLYARWDQPEVMP
jgi:quinohemoprotein amine dehydrogenase